MASQTPAKEDNYSKPTEQDAFDKKMINPIIRKTTEWKPRNLVNRIETNRLICHHFCNETWKKLSVSSKATKRVQILDIYYFQ